MDLHEGINERQSHDASICDNCNRTLEMEAKISIFEADEHNSTHEGDVRIWNAIAYIYGIDGVSLTDEKLKDSLTTRGRMDSFSNVGLVDEPVGMCKLCATLLFDTYKAFKQFQSLTHQASLIRQVQKSCERKSGNCNDAAKQSVTPTSNSLTVFPSSDLAEDNLFDSFNFENNVTLSDEYQDSFTEDYKYDQTDDFFETKSVPMQELHLTQDQSGQSQVSALTKMSPRFSKEIVIKIERISEEDLEQYSNSKRRKNKTTTSSRKLNAKTSKPRQNIPDMFSDDVSKKSTSGSKKDARQLYSSRHPVNSTELGASLKRKIKPVQKYQHEIVKSKLPSSLKKQKKEPLTAKEKKKHECRICGKRFTTRIELRYNHMPIHFEDVSCKICNKKLGGKGILRKHMKFVHMQASEDEIKKFMRTCHICGKTMLKYNFKLHIERHGPRESIKCDKCDKEYLTKTAYAEHVLTHTQNFNPHLCNYCGATFENRSSLYIHEKRHTEGKKFSCHICSKKFFLKSELQEHILVHSSERKFVCEECGITYKHKSQLKRHQKIHKDLANKEEYSCRCKYCARLFKHSEALRLHMKGHENNFECSFCGKRLHKALSLKKHENLHRKNPDYQPRKQKTWKSDIPYQLNSVSSSGEQK